MDAVPLRKAHHGRQTRSTRSAITSLFMFRCLDSTKDMINKDAFDQMKDGVVILNFARDTSCQ